MRKITLLFLLLFSFFSKNTNAQCIPSGNQTTYGTTTWIGYVYDNTANANASVDAFNSLNYKGFINQNEAFDYNLGNGSVSGPNLCGTYANKFAIRFRKTINFPNGTYTFRVGGDDGYRLSVNGGTSFIINNWNDHSYTESTVSVTLNGSTNLVLEYYENGGESRVAFSYCSSGNTSTAPTSISGGSTAVCSGSNVTLTAVGGVLAPSSGSYYQWGTGNTVGSNIIAGQNGVSINVNPSAGANTYWVRIVNCSANTTGVSQTLPLTAAPGNPAVFGANIWNVYGYSIGDISLATSVYKGFYTQSTLGFDTQSGANSWANNLSPSSSAGWSGCPVTNDDFTMVHKRKGFPCGRYTLTLNNWDDATNVYIDGVLVWSCATWSGGGSACTGNIGTFNLNTSSEIEVRVREIGGGANVSLSIANININSTAPLSITGNTTTCVNSATVLTAAGGILGSSGVYQWGTGTILGSNIIVGETNASITVMPSATTTYWVRRVDTLCSLVTSGLTQTVTTTATTVAGTLSTTDIEICKNTKPNPIVLSGNTGSVVKWQHANDAAFTAGVTDIVSTATTLSSNDMGALTATRYYRAVVKSGSCNELSTPTLGIIVPAVVIYNGGWSGAVNTTSTVIIQTNLDINSDLNVCACEVENNSIITIKNNKTLFVKMSIKIAPTANIVVEDGGSIVQLDEVSDNIGSINLRRDTTPLKQYDYTYWSSPVQGTPLTTVSNPSIYYRFDIPTNNWVYLPGSTIMLPGSGYIARVPNNLDFTTSPLPKLNVEFIGKPNSGKIFTTIQKTASSKYNLIGNPYPSAVDAVAFILHNQANIGGTIYFWSHNTALGGGSNTGSQSQNYSSNDYAKFNLTGGVGTAKATSDVTGTNNFKPNGYIATGQAFFVEALNDNVVLEFNNAMRSGGANKNNQFFKNSSNIAENKSNRLWLNISNTQGAYDEMLLGYVAGATNDYDNNYDGKIRSAGNNVMIYSILADARLSIQGRDLAFNDSEIIPMGYRSKIAGTLTIAIESFDGFFDKQEVYLVDKTNNVVTDLKNGSYTFTTEIGTFENRFELKYRNATLGTDDLILNNNEVVVFTDQNLLNIKSKTENIKSVVVYDLLGRMVFQKNDINDADFSSNQINASKQIVIVKVKLENDRTTVKKVILN